MVKKTETGNNLYRSAPRNGVARQKGGDSHSVGVLHNRWVKSSFLFHRSGIPTAFQHTGQLKDASELNVYSWLSVS